MVWWTMKTVDARGMGIRRTIIPGLFNSTLTWILMGFFIAYILFFYRPIYENSYHVMYFPTYVPPYMNVGSDLASLRDWSRQWIEGKANPYVEYNFFNPPLTVVLFAAFSYVPFSWAFRIASASTMAVFFFSAFLFPLFYMGKRSVSPILLLIFAMGLMSYGFQFEIERGQFNIVTTGCALLAVLIYRAAPRYRWIAFLLITIAIQLKIYPAIFILLFIENWNTWRRHLRDLAVILVMNIISLFILGIPRFFDFIKIVGERIADPYIRVHNMSAKSFATLVFPDNPSIIMALIFGLFIVCLIGALWYVSTRRQAMARYYLFLVCTVGALVIPSVSFDYKLPLLVAPVVILLDSITLSQNNIVVKIGRIASLVICSAVFASTLFSFTNKIFIPGIGDAPISILIQNNLPSLMVLLVGFAFLTVTQNSSQDAPSIQKESAISPI